MNGLKLWSKGTIEELLAKYNKPIKKSLGQNYLLDYHTLANIAAHTRKISSATIIEIGPGLGGLTQVCLAETSHPLIAVELDDYSYTILEDIFFKNFAFPSEWQSRLKLVHGDILTYTIPPDTLKPYIFIGNLPYYLATTILIELIEKYSVLGENCFAQGIFMVQKEVADRLIATPHKKSGRPTKGEKSAYGAITVLLAVHGQVKKIQNLAPIQFYPPPKVNSTVVSFMPHQKPLVKSSDHYRILKTLVKGVFHYRRKTLTNAVKELLKASGANNTKTPLNQLSQINPEDIQKIIKPWGSLRAEDVSPTEYLRISEELFHCRKL